MLNLVLGLLGCMFDELVQLCWGWYVHVIVMIFLTIPMTGLFLKQKNDISSTSFLIELEVNKIVI